MEVEKLNSLRVELLKSLRVERLFNKKFPLLWERVRVRADFTNIWQISAPTSVLPLKGGSKAASTLAEVLITLGVIGVVAAMTMPTLIANYQKKQTLEKLKSTYSILNNAIEMAKVDYGTNVNEWTVPTGSDKEVSDYFADHYLIPYLKVVKDCKSSTDGICTLEYKKLNGDEQTVSSDTSRIFTLANGVIVYLWASTNYSTYAGGYRTIITMFLNGNKKNNVMGRDIFRIEIGNYDKNRFLPFGYFGDAVTVESLTSSDQTNNCNKDKSGEFCFALIMVEGWQITDNYPW